MTRRPCRGVWVLETAGPVSLVWHDGAYELQRRVAGTSIVSAALRSSEPAFERVAKELLQDCSDDDLAKLFLAFDAHRNSVERELG